MSFVSVLTAAAAITLAADVSALPQGGERVMRTMPVRDIFGYPTQESRAPFGSMLIEQDESFVTPIPIDEDRRIYPETVTDFIRVVLEQEQEDHETVVAIVSSRLALSGRRGSVERAERVARYIESVVAAPVRIEARLFELDGDEDVGAVAAAGEPTGLAGKPLAWSATGVTRAGSGIALALSHHRQFLVDCDVEVAQDQSISDPTVRSMFEGVHVTVEPHAVPGSGDLVLYCDARISELREEMQSRSTGIDAMAALDVPVVANNHVAFSGRVSSRGSLVATVGGDEAGGSRYALVVTATRDQPQAEDPMIELLPFSALVSGALSQRAMPSRVSNYEDDHSIFPLRIDEVPAAVQAGTVREIMRHVLEPYLDEDRVRFDTSGGWMFVAGEAPVRKIARDAAVALHEQWIRGAVCDLTTRAVAEGRGANGESVGRVLHRLRIPVLAGRTHVCIRGVESTTVHDVQVEIAQEASAANPVVGTTFSGLLANVAVFDDTDGYTTDIEATISHVLSTVRRSAETRHGGDLFLTETSRAEFSHEGGIDAGREVDLGDAGFVHFDKRPYRLRQSVRVSDL